MKRRLKELAMLVAVLFMLAVIVIVSGIVPVKASSGHWPITRWILGFASSRSVGLHSSGIEVPPLDEPGIVRLGAATYDNNCRWCHGSPGTMRPPVAAKMTPHPPVLSDSAGSWEDAELAYLIKHGIKFTAMPAWPTQMRDDEIWPVVAFLRELPNMGAERYQELVQSEIKIDVDESSLNDLIQSCHTCHGHGSGTESHRVPVISGQKKLYLRGSLLAYQSGKRYSGVMMPIAHWLTDQQIDALATYFSEQAGNLTPLSSSPLNETIEKGRALAHQGSLPEKIPSCVDCHGPGEILRSDEYPKLAGQPAWYIRQQLELFATQRRGGSENFSLMHPIAVKLDDSQRLALSEYYASLNGSEEN